MNAQVFRGRTLAEARRAAKKKLGSDAVVLTTRPVRRDGIAGWFGSSEIEIAAIAAQVEDVGPAPRADLPFARGVYTNATTKPESDVSALRAELKGDIRALRNIVSKSDDMPQVAAEIAQLRQLIEGLSETAAASAPRNDKGAARLRALGIEGPAAAALARSLRKAGGEGALRDELARIISVAPFPLVGERQLIALVGPSGVGKTTTAAKLGARARAAGRTVTFVACDAYRVGGTAQLGQYARLMGADCVAARTSDDLRAAIDSARTDVVIVDTSGRPPVADGVEIGIAPSRRAARTASRTRQVLLCVPASIRANDAARIVRRFGTLSPTSLAITKIDETETPAGIVHASWAARIAISVMCNGQRVPEDIVAATIESLIECVAPKTRESEAAA